MVDPGYKLPQGVHGSNGKSSGNTSEKDDAPAPWIIDLTDEDFANAIMSNEKIVVEFWQELCLPCAIMKPLYENVSENYRSELKTARSRVDRTQAVLKLFGVFNVPTFLFFHNGKIVDTLIGVVSEESLNNSMKRLATA